MRRYVHDQLFIHSEAAQLRHGLSWMNRLMVTTILAAILLTVLASEETLFQPHRALFIGAEMVFGVIFGVEYLARVWAVVEDDPATPAWKMRLRFMATPVALLDLIVVISSLLPFFFSDLAVLRLIRLLRLAALIKFSHFSIALRELMHALTDRRYELLVTLALGGGLLLLGATALYWAEREVQPEAFGSIPRALYWAVITLTAVGYGDVSPVTPLGKLLASLVAMSGIGLVAMPTGIMAAAFSDAMQRRRALNAPTLARREDDETDPT
ncbi:potassium channel family protein [Novosphingobium sp. MBES04]|uniref:potassium channel family protein n=1 Tax=Novosphingobium sp. MBES04 TaxID=1206458 RepID=UPI00057EEA47|nr:potassium channel family protein [Novosphingobium sp. MBES04]GAM03328.1 potassium voltage-gated channel subfamily KQT [Novosphingobium sp. MBES04]